MSRRRDFELGRATAMVLLAASVVVHVPFGVAEFSFDDRDFIQVNESIRSVAGAWNALLAPFPPDQPERGLYRPITNLTYAFDHALFGDNARGYHATNVFLYLAIVLLIYQLALRYRPSPNFAFAVALIFSVHPAHTGAVDSLAGRSELLALVFVLTSTLLFLRGVQAAGTGRRALAGSLLVYALACLSKETGAVLPGILAFHALLFHPPRGSEERVRRNRVLKSIGAYALVLVAYLALRLAVLGRFSPGLGVLSGQSFETRLLTMGAVFFEYLRLLVYPRILQIDFYYHDTIGLPQELSAASICGGIGLVTCLALLAALSFRRLRAKPSQGDEEGGAPTSDVVAIVALATFLIFLLPVSHVFDIGALLAERFLLAPSFGFILGIVLVVALLLRRGLAAKRQRVLVAASLLAVIVVAGGWRSAARAVEWRDHVRLWEAAASAIPWDPRSHLNLGAAYLERGELAAGQAALERALALDPRNTFALGNVGVIQLRQGDNEGAASTYRRMIEVEPENAIAWHNLGLSEAQRLRHSEAVRLFTRSLELNPNFAPAHENLQQSQRVISQATDILAQWREAGMDSEDPLVLNELAAACTVIGDYACAEYFATRSAGFSADE